MGSHAVSLSQSQVVKQRLQLKNSNAKTVLSTFRQIYKTEGLSALWISYPTTLSARPAFSQRVHRITLLTSAFLLDQQR